MAGADGHSDAGRVDLSATSQVEAPAYANDVLPDATFHTFRLSPELSCRDGLTAAQQGVCNLFFAGLGVVSLYAPLIVLSGLSIALWGIFACLIAWRLVLIVFGVWRWQFHRQRNCNVLDIEKPVYSILVPVVHETEIMHQLSWALSQIVWPDDKLDIQLLFEQDDLLTLQAAKAEAFPPGTRFTIVPAGDVRTKPNALNHGLGLARGDYVCIYDAEDRPHPGQLLEAYRAFQAADESLACVQAPLIADNGEEALIAAHWQLEYATQFHLLLPAKAMLGLPMPIGGTSNHFRRQALLEAGGWDAWNVTEDADLGLRFATRGQRVGVLNLGTHEDAPTTFRVWSAQRSRWIKGFIQTWSVRMRHPVKLYKQLGFWRFLALQLTLGGAVLAPVFHAPMLIFVVLALLFGSLSIGPFGTSLLLTGLAVGFLSDILSPGAWHRGRVLAILTRPLYWPLHTVSAVRALWELATRPHFWAKTPHTPHVRAKETQCSTGLSA